MSGLNRWIPPGAFVHHVPQGGAIRLRTVLLTRWFARTLAYLNFHPPPRHLARCDARDAAVAVGDAQVVVVAIGGLDGDGGDLVQVAFVNPHAAVRLAGRVPFQVQRAAIGLLQPCPGDRRVGRQVEFAADFRGCIPDEVLAARAGFLRPRVARARPAPFRPPRLGHHVDDLGHGRRQHDAGAGNAGELRMGGPQITERCGAGVAQRVVETERCAAGSRHQGQRPFKAVGQRQAIRGQPDRAFSGAHVFPHHRPQLAVIRQRGPCVRARLRIRPGQDGRQHLIPAAHLLVVVDRAGRQQPEGIGVRRLDQPLVAGPAVEQRDDLAAGLRDHDDAQRIVFQPPGRRTVPTIAHECGGHRSTLPVRWQGWLRVESPAAAGASGSSGSTRR